MNTCYFIFCQQAWKSKNSHFSGILDVQTGFDSLVEPDLCRFRFRIRPERPDPQPWKLVPHPHSEMKTVLLLQAMLQTNKKKNIQD